MQDHFQKRSASRPGSYIHTRELPVQPQPGRHTASFGGAETPRTVDVDGSQFSLAACS